MRYNTINSAFGITLTRALNTSPLKRLKTKLSQTSYSLTIPDFTTAFSLFLLAN